MSKSYIITNTKFGNSSVAIKNFLSSVKQNHYLKTKQSSELIALKQLKKLETAYFVPQHYVGYTDFATNEKAMITTGLKTCLGLGIYNPTTLKAALVHVDDVCTYSSITKVVKEVSRGNKSKLKMAITGGCNMSTEHLLRLKDWLKNMPDTEIVLDKSFQSDKKLKSHKLYINAQGNFLTEEAIDDTILFNQMHPFKSPEVYNIIQASFSGVRYDLATLNFANNMYEPLIELVDYHPLFYTPTL